MNASKFSTRLVLEEHVKGGKSVPGEWVLFKPLVYETARRRFVVPKGFITDLASIPRPFRTLLDVNDSHRRAAVLHDFGYVAQTQTREQVDDMFLESMEVLEVPAWKRYLMYGAVRAGGWMYWNKRSKDRQGKANDFVSPDYFSGE